jgi:hypothetical protein
VSPSVVTYCAKIRCIETDETMELRFTPCSPGDAGKYVRRMLHGLILSTSLDWVSEELEEVQPPKTWRQRLAAWWARR